MGAYRKSACLIASSWLALSGAAARAVSVSYDMGVLPSGEGADFYSNPSRSETTFFSASGGFLFQNSFGVTGSFVYVYPNVTFAGGGIDATKNLAIEARLRIRDDDANGVLDIGPKPGGAFFQATNGVNVYGLYIGPTGAFVWSTSGTSVTYDSQPGTVTQFFAVAPVNVGSYHTYRLESPAGSNEVRLFIDDAYALTTTAPVGAGNYLDFGDLAAVDSAATANAIWDYVHLSQPGVLTPVPEASTLALVAAIAVLARARRRS